VTFSLVLCTLYVPIDQTFILTLLVHIKHLIKFFNLSTSYSKKVLSLKIDDKYKIYIYAQVN